MLAARIVILFGISLLGACASTERKAECSLISNNETWSEIEKPIDIQINVIDNRSEYVSWYQSPDGVVKFCKRHIRYKCFEEVGTFKQVGGEWVENKLRELVVCT